MVEFEPLSCKERLWDQCWFSQGLQGHPAASSAWRGQEGMEEVEACSWQGCMAGRWEAVAQTETWESQTGDKEKPFTQWDTPAIGPRAREVGLSRSLGVSHPSCMRSWAAWSEPVAETAWAKGWDHGLPRFPLAQIVLPFRWYLQTELNTPWMKQTSEQTKTGRNFHSVSFFSTNLNSDLFFYMVLV